MSAAADGCYAVKPCALYAHQRFGIAAAIRFEQLQRPHSLHIKRGRVGYLKIAVESRQLLGTVCAVVSAESLAELLEIFTADIQTRCKRVTAEALKMLGACRKRVKQIKSGIAAARALALVAVEAYHHRRQRILLGELRCRNADNSLMPVFTCQNNGCLRYLPRHHFACIGPYIRFKRLTPAV